MGLLSDVLNSDDGRMALGLLAAAGPSFTPMSIGQRLQAAQGYVRDQQNADLTQQLNKAKLNEANLGAVSQQLSIQQQLNWLRQTGAVPPTMTISDLQAAIKSTPGQLPIGGSTSPQTDSQPQFTASQPPTTMTVQPTADQSDTGVRATSNNWNLALPGLSDSMSRTIAAGMPQSEYLKLLANTMVPQTDITKLLTAAGIKPGSAEWSAAVLQNLYKQNYVAPVVARAGAPIYDQTGSNIVSMAPSIPSNSIPQIVGGKVTGVVPLPGATEIEQANAKATAAGKQEVVPAVGYNPATKQPQATNALTMATGGGDSNSFTGQPVANAGPFDPSKPITGNFVGNKNQVLDAILAINDPTERNRALQAFAQQAQAQKSSALLPELPPGVKPSQEALANAGAARFNKLVETASDSPTRVNVYDNILKLSKEGVNSGPGEAWKNSVKGYIANTPFLASVTPANWKNDVSGFDELNKFLYQNAQRNWQAAGGTGTDAQLEAFSKSNPNSKMFPQALQAMAEWGKAGELALQAKANAAQQWKLAQNGDVTNHDQFETMWRNNFDPRLFQMKLMTPDQVGKFVADLKAKNPNDYATLMMKAKALKNIGGL